jgi:hypothetical protein
MDCIAWVPDNSDTAESGNNFLKKLEPLRSDLREEEGRPREVAARASEIGNEADRIASDRHNDGYRRGRLLRRTARRCAFRDDDVHLEADQVGREDREPVVVPVRISVLDGDVLALDIPQARSACRKIPM